MQPPHDDRFPGALPALVCRAAVAFVWLYQGLVPKLLGPDAGELLMNTALGISPRAATEVSYVAGACEIILGIVVLALPHRAWPLQVTVALMIGLLAYASWATPQFLTAAFNPVTINVAVAALSLAGLLLMPRANQPRPSP